MATFPFIWPSLPAFFCLISFFFFFFLTKRRNSSSSSSTQPPKSYPLIGSAFAIVANKHRRPHWITDILHNSPFSTFLLHRPLGLDHVFTAYPPTVRHILKTSFPLYQKGSIWRTSLRDFLGNGIFNSDGDSWKLQRHLSAHQFTTNSLRGFVHDVVDTELSFRLLPILHTSSTTSTTVDLQDLLQRFAFDNICSIAFGHDPACLSPTLPHDSFAAAFEDATSLSAGRFNSVVPFVWKLKRLLGVGSEKRLRAAIDEIHEFARNVLMEKKRKKGGEEADQTKSDLLTLFLNSGNYSEEDDSFVIDMITSFVLAGRDTTSAALLWFFWLVDKHPAVETEIVREIREKEGGAVYEEVKDMPYTHAALCESMRLYPPVPFDTKEVMGDDQLPCGRKVRKGMRITYCPYSMGRMEGIWGKDWREYRPERWLEKEEEKWKFVGRDVYEYPVFQAGPRICLGKEMAFLQMKRVVAGVLGGFKVVAVGEGEPELVVGLTAKIKGGFPVRVEERKKDEFVKK